MIEAAKVGGREVKKFYGKSITIFNKSTVADFRTEADLASNKAILDKLQIHFPDYNFFSEESGWEKRNSEYTFVIDPLDGTNNFAIGLPNFSVSIALLEGNQIVAGVTYNPITEETFFAEKGKGAFLNGSSLQTSEITEIEKATVAYTCGYKTENRFYQEFIRQNVPRMKRFMSNWSPCLDYCRVASGKIEAVICNGNEVYDNLVGKLLIKEAGGVVTRFDGNLEEDEKGVYFVASNNKDLHKIVLERCMQIGPDSL